MKVSCYCQHVLGIGHLHRSIQICNAIAEISSNNKVQLIVGGPEVSFNNKKIDVVRLPGLKMDHEFNNLVPCLPGSDLDDVKKKRLELLFTHFEDFQPDVFITELYPFGRKAFRFELDPILKAIQDGRLKKCFCCSSVRDILVEKQRGREKYETRVIHTLNSYFDALLIHSDPSIITLEETFGKMGEISVPLHYTGFVTNPEVSRIHTKSDVRHALQLLPATKLIVASIGGGSVGEELLFNTIEAFKMLDKNGSYHLQLFCGPYSNKNVVNALRQQTTHNISLDRFTDHFQDWLGAADLSISMAGYNTTMNLLHSGIPALVHPFAQNREQRMRAEKLIHTSAIRIIDESETISSTLAQLMAEQLTSQRKKGRVDLNGAKTTADILSHMIQHGVTR